MNNLPYRYIMTPAEFMKKVRDLYQLAKHPIYYHPKIRRGRSRLISAIAEDLFAVFIAFNLLEDFDIYIDQAITINDQKRMTIYPDISLISHSKLKNIIDVKMDLGWIRGQLSEICGKKKETIIKIRDKGCHIKDGITKEMATVSIHENCKYHMLIISGLNIRQRQLEEQIKEASVFEPEVSCYVLSFGEHPNAYIEDKEFYNKLDIHQNEFDRFFNNITS